MTLRGIFKGYPLFVHYTIDNSTFKAQGYMVIPYRTFFRPRITNMGLIKIRELIWEYNLTTLQHKVKIEEIIITNFFWMDKL